MSKKAKNKDEAKQLLEYLGSAAAANIYLKTDSSDVAANKRASTARYNAFQKKAATLIGSSKHIAQYMDRDTRPDFASTVMIPALQQFLNHPDDVNSLVKSIQKQKKSIFGTEPVASRRDGDRHRRCGQEWAARAEDARRPALDR